MVEPSGAAVSQFTEFTGYPDRTVAALFLKGNDNSLEKAIEAYFNDPNPARFQNADQGYSESDFTAGRSGDANDATLVPYQLDDAAQMQIGGSAPSRPPSRMSQMGNQGPQGFIGPVYEGEHEAIKRSLEQQETGVIGSAGQEYVPDPPPEQRQRPHAGPAFMKPLLRKDFLPSLITILHSIPQCRQALLRTSDVLPDYGHNTTWWEGESVEVAQIVDYTQSDSSLNSTEVLYEVQRLVAFLDQTQRAYGSVEALASLPALKKIGDAAWSTKPLFAQFMESWETSSENSTIETGPSWMFSSRVTGSEGEQSWAHETRRYFSIISDVKPKFEDEDPTLYDALDKQFWPATTKEQDNHDRWLQAAAAVMVFHIQPPLLRHNGRRIIVPKSFDPDMYLLSNQERVKSVRAQMEECLQAKEEIDDKLFGLQKFSTAQFRHADGQAFLNAAIHSLKQRNQTNGVEARDTSEIVVIDPKVASRLEVIADKIQNHVQAFKDELSNIKARYQQLAESIVHSTPTSGSLGGGYELCGVATNPSARVSITYAKYSSQYTQDSQAMDETDGTVTKQWWKMKYDFTGGSALVKQERVPENEVLEAAGKDGEETLLVYARDDLLSSAEGTPLPDPLQSFVEADNQTFRDEMNSEKPTEIILGKSLDDEEMMPLSQDEKAAGPELARAGRVPDVVMADPTQMQTNDMPEKLQEMEQIQTSSSRMSFISTGQEHSTEDEGSDTKMEP